MPPLAPITDIVIDPDSSLSEVLPQTTDDDGTVTYAASGLAEWMTFTPSTRILSGTAPNASSTAAVTYTATDSNGVISTETFDIVVRLGLGDFNTSNLEVEALALIQAGPRNVAAVWARAPRTARGRLLSGEFDLNNNVFSINELRFSQSAGNSPGGERITLNDNGSLHLGNFFGANNPGNDLVIHIQTDDSSISFPLKDSLLSSGGNYVNFNVPEAFRRTVAGIEEGDRFVFALTRPFLFRRLDSLDDLDFVFARANTTASVIGTWEIDTGGSTVTPGTGPGNNSVGAFAFSDASGRGTEADIAANSALTVRPEIMSAWTGIGRQMRFRASIAGVAWTSTGEGLEVQGRVDSTGSWSRIRLIPGWAYSDTYFAGNAIIDGAGNALTCVQAGGWVDFSVEIPNDHTEVRIRSMPVAGAGLLFQHDAALWHIELRAGSPDTTPTAPAVDDQTAIQGVAFSVTLAAGSGGNAPLIHAVNGRPEWLNFNPSTRILGGTPDATGTHDLTYTVRDADGDEATDTFRVTVNEPDTTPTAPAVADQSAIQGVPFTTVLDAGSGGNAPLTYTVTGRPAWLAFNPATRVLTGLPPDTGTLNLVYTVRDADGDEATDAFTFTVNEPDTTPTAPAVDDQSAVQGVPFTVTLDAGSGGNPPLGHAVGGRPGWLNFNPSTRILGGTPDATGTHDLTYTVRDADGDEATDTFRVTVNEPDTTPTAPAVDDQTAIQGVPFTVTLDAGSGGNPPLGHAVGGRPEWLNFNPSTRILGGTPDATGTHDLTYTVRDADGDEATDTFRVTVNEPDTTPTAPAVADQSAIQGVPFTTVLDAGSGGNAPLTYTVTGRPAWLAFNPATRVLTGLPPDTGTLNLVYTVRDADGDEATDAFTFTVNEPDTTPTAPAVDDQSAVQGVPFTVTLDAGSGGNPPLGHAVGGRPGWLNFNPSTRILGGTPDATGTHDLTYTVRDADGDEATDTFRVTVNEPDTTPTAPAVDDQTAIQGVPFTVTLDAGSGGNPPLGHAVGGRPEWLNFNPSTRILGGTPDATGTHDLTYTVRDADGDEATDTFRVTVNEPDTTPTAPAVADQSAIQGVPFTTVLDAGSGGNAPLTYTVTGRPAWLAFNPATRVLTGLPPDTGTLNLVYTVRDADGDEATDAFTFTVNEPDTTPTAPAVDDQSAVQGVPFTVTLDAGSGGNPPLGHAVGGRPGWLNFNPSTRILGGTPDATGTHDLTYTVRDADGDEATDTFRVTVNEPDTTPTAPAVDDQTAIQGVPFTVTLDAGSGGNPPLGHAVGGRPEWLNFNPSTRILGGTPDATGTHDLTYTVRDADGDEATDTFRVTVNEPDTTPTAPAVADQSAIQGVAFSATLDAGSGGNAPLGYAVSGRPGWLNFNPSTRILGGTPDATGTHDLTYTVRDADGDEATDAFRVVISEPDTVVPTDGRPAAPAPPQVEAVSETSLSATWTAPIEGDAPITSYSARISVAGRDTWLESTRVTSPHVFKELEQGTKYIVQIQAINSLGTSNWSVSGLAPTHILLEATEAKGGELFDYRTDWDKEITYKVKNNGKVLLFFNHSNTVGINLTAITTKTVKEVDKETLQ